MENRKLLPRLLILVVINVMVSVSVKAYENVNHSTGNITFVPGDGIEEGGPQFPPDPENPDVEIEGDIDTDLDQISLLGFNYLINNMDFRNVIIREGGARIPMLAEVKKHTNGEMLPTYSMIQTRDLRGNGKGWTVHATMSEVRHTSIANQKLEGVSIELLDGILVDGNIMYDRKIIINPNTRTEIMSGNNSELSTLMWIRQLDENNIDGLLNQSIQLVIPSNRRIVAGNYVGEIEWTIASLPDGNS